MRALIIEDEQMAATALATLLSQESPGIEILAVLQSIDECVEWFGSNPMPDLIFADIHLADGLSFSVFESVKVTCPVVFTTAYDEYALKAFEVNSIDYLLKPISKNSLGRALDKYGNLHGATDIRPGGTSSGSPGGIPLGTPDTVVLKQIMEGLLRQDKNYRRSLLVAFRDKLIPLPVEDIAYIGIEDNTIQAATFSGIRHVLDTPLDELIQYLDPQLFFRANRQYIISRKAVEDLSIWFGGKLSVNISVEPAERIIVSKARVREFKQWVAGEL